MRHISSSRDIGHWAPNDPRGSESTTVAKPQLRELGPIHYGRKRVQPSRTQLRTFHRAFEARLDHPIVWFDEWTRATVAQGIGRVILDHGYTCYACAVLRNHFHLVIRTHRDDAATMNGHFERQTAQLLRDAQHVSDEHPVWSGRPWKVFLRTRAEVVARIGYVERNPIKEGLPAQTHPFVVSYPR